MVLPGKIAKATRTQFADVITRYIAGDASLVPEIEANANSNSSVAVMARESLGLQEDIVRKRRREDLEDYQLFMRLMGDLDPDWQAKDTRLVLNIKDQLKNALNPNQITNGEARTLTITDVARQLGHGILSHSQACVVGKRLAKLYFDKHGKKPEKREQFMDGARRTVNDYTEEDRDLIVEALEVLDDE
jgi:UDP-N-acetylglucosamine enolpyruvyl transferase